MTYKERYNAIHLEWSKTKFPSVHKDGFYTPPKQVKINTANGLTNFIINYLTWSGNHGERTNTMGRPIQKFAPKMNLISGKVENIENGIEWQKGTGKKGSSDIKALITVDYQKFAIPIFIEIKIKDKQSNEQKDYEKAINKAGGIYAICHNPDEFFNLFDKIKANELII